MRLFLSLKSLMFFTLGLVLFAASSVAEINQAPPSVESLSSNVVLPDIFSNGMVIQRGRVFRVWGQAKAGTNIKIEFAGETKQVISQKDRWSLEFAPRELTAQPLVMNIFANNQLIRQIVDILVGEIWLASGQSNMQMALGGTKEKDAAFQRPEDPLLRCFNVPSKDLITKNPPLGTVWQKASRSAIGNWSAVAYHFAHELRKSLQVPIGLVNCSLGATTTEAWCSPELLAQGYPHYEKFYLSMDKSKAPPYAHPSFCYERMLSTVMPYSIRGILWYQGEGNTGRWQEQERLFPALVQEWRQKWDNPNMPVYFVQLARFEQGDWHPFRDAQRRIWEKLPHSFMAVTIDLPKDYDPNNHPIHPNTKQPIGERLALAANKLVYGLDIPTFSGPRIKSATFLNDTISLSFDFVGQGLKTSDGQALRGFSVASADMKFVMATATVEGDLVQLRGFGSIEPKWVRYGSEADMGKDKLDVNLSNRDGLPASPFTRIITR